MPGPYGHALTDLCLSGTASVCHHHHLLTVTPPPSPSPSHHLPPLALKVDKGESGRRDQELSAASGLSPAQPGCTGHAESACIRARVQRLGRPAAQDPHGPDVRSRPSVPGRPSWLRYQPRSWETARWCATSCCCLQNICSQLCRKAAPPAASQALTAGRQRAGQRGGRDRQAGGVVIKQSGRQSIHVPWTAAALPPRLPTRSPTAHQSFAPLGRCFQLGRA